MPVSLAAGAAAGISGAVVQIGHVVTDGTSPSVIFSNIPQNYQDLMLVVNARTSYQGSYSSYSIYTNGTGTGGWSTTNFATDGTSITTGRATFSYGMSINIPYGGALDGILGQSITHILGYSSTTKYKNFLSQCSVESNGSGFIEFKTGRFAYNDPITIFNIDTNGNYAVGSSFTLYGIRAGI